MPVFAHLLPLGPKTFLEGLWAGPMPTPDPGELPGTLTVLCVGTASFFQATKATDGSL